MADSVPDRSTAFDSERQDTPAEIGVRIELMQSDIYTAEEAINKVGVGIFQVKLCILSGFVWMSRGFEMVLIRSINPLMTCDWNLETWYGALFTTVTMLSTILGCFLYGIWSDKYGRRMALSSSLIFLFVFGAVSSGLPSYTWFLIFRAVAAFATGGLSQTLVLCCEYMTANKRGRAIYILPCFWGLGVILMLCLLYLTMGNPVGWRIFIASGTLPAFLAMIMMRFFPESYRFLLVSNQYVAANEIMCEMAEANQQIIEGHLYPLTVGHTRKTGQFGELFNRQYVRTTLVLWVLGIATAIAYLGLNRITPHLAIDRMQEQRNVSSMVASATVMNFLGDVHAPIPCVRNMTLEQFTVAVGTTALDFPGLLVYWALVDFLDRKKLLMASYLLSAFFTFLLLIPPASSSTTMLLSFVYCARTLLMGQFDLLLLIAAEIFPTSHRGRAVGVVAGSVYMGHFIGSYVIQVLLWLSFIYPVIVLGVISFLASVAALFVGGETRGKELLDIFLKGKFISTYSFSYATLTDGNCSETAACQCLMSISDFCCFNITEVSVVFVQTAILAFVGTSPNDDPE